MNAADLKKFALLSELSDEDREALFELLEPVTLSKGRSIYREGNEADGLVAIEWNVPLGDVLANLLYIFGRHLLFVEFEYQFPNNVVCLAEIAYYDYLLCSRHMFELQLPAGRPNSFPFFLGIFAKQDLVDTHCLGIFSGKELRQQPGHPDRI